MKKAVANVMLVDIVSAKHMKIAILSDIHDNIWNLQAALTGSQQADVLICCGDLCSPFVIAIMAEGFSRPIHLVFGNNDGDLARITNVANRFPNFHLEGEFFETEWGGKKIAANHYDNIGLPLAHSGIYDLVCFGHNHRYQVEKFGKTLAINPGTLMGYNPLVRKEVPATFVIYDTQDESVASFQVQASTDGSNSRAVFPYPS